MRVPKGEVRLLHNKIKILYTIHLFKNSVLIDFLELN